MTKEVCRDYLDRAIEALEDMREALDDSAPDAAISFLEAALDAQDLVGRAILEAMRAVVTTKGIGDEA
ncbi:MULTISPECIES: hypothetical protein [Gammaproteobacteria]|jgi:hypothetical protein|uniref:hypothetical protein n=1 Tax=Gammaproteobacteria TaxID=1236 RepID=UPI000E92225A|nr:MULTISPECIES: hypothetical protein [Gammaproteobacteria]MEA0721925.1 hypothetical protein [Xanthomonas campestris pv. campestris]HBF49706.1 hypothetical protein [Massilia sp.]